MTDERCAVEALGRCRFAPGTWDKKFAHSIAATAEDYTLTPKQREWVWKLTKKYRRQMPRLAVKAAEEWLARSPDEIAFREAIYAAPDDFAPRLVFADWLDERGQSDLAEVHRWMAAQQATLKLVACGTSYGPGEPKGINFEWTFGMDVWRMFSCLRGDCNHLPYHHRSQEAAERAMAKALAGKRLLSELTVG